MREQNYLCTEIRRMTCRTLFLLLSLVPLCLQGRSFMVRNASISYDASEPYQVVRAIGDLQHDIALVAGVGEPTDRQIVVGTYGQSQLISDLITKGLLKASELEGRW